MVPPSPAHADSAPIVLLLPDGSILVVGEGDPDTPDGTIPGSNYVVYNENGDQIEVDHNWLTEFVFTTYGSLIELIK
jgi:hypothetical protein